MRSSARRSKKYKAKTDGGVSKARTDAYGSVQKGQFRKRAGSQVAIERKVKTILEASGSMVGLNHFYMNFGKKLAKIKTTYTGGATMWDEACIEYGKWELRGLDKDILDQITCIIMVSPCNPCPDPPPAYGLPWTGQVTVHYAGDDGSYQKGYTLTRPIVKGVGSIRFTDNGNGTISDAATGLMWVKDPINDLGAPFDAGMSCNDAITNCEALTFAGHSDWRLPNINELMSIIDRDESNPCLDIVFFPNAQTLRHWSSTIRDGSPLNAWRSGFNLGINGWSAMTTLYWVRPVRLGQP